MAVPNIIDNYQKNCISCIHSIIHTRSYKPITSSYPINTSLTLLPAQIPGPCLRNSFHLVQSFDGLAKGHRHELGSARCWHTSNESRWYFQQQGVQMVCL